MAAFKICSAVAAPSRSRLLISHEARRPNRKHRLTITVGLIMEFRQPHDIIHYSDSGVSIEDRGCDDNFVCDESMQAGINKSDDTVDPIIAINDLSRHITHEYLMSDPQGVACEHSVGGQWFGGHLLLNTNLRSQTKKRYRVLYTEGTQISRDYTISQVKSMHQAGELKILFLPAHVRSMELLRSAAGG